MKLLRVYMLPHGEQWCDFPIPEAANAQTVWPQIVSDGVASSANAVVPKSMIHHILILEVQENEAKFTVFPGGKPN